MFDGSDLTVAAEFSGGAGADELTGGDGWDWLYGDGGGDIIAGEEGDDTLDGGAGNDVLFGGAGADILIAGSGTDTLTGGSGSDRFVVGGEPSSTDTIADFSACYKNVLELNTVSGEEGFVDLGNPDNLNFADEISIEAWFKVDSLETYSTLVSKWYSGGERGSFSLSWGPNGLGFHVSNSANQVLSASSGKAYDDGAWHRVVGSYDSSKGEISIYIDGALADSTTDMAFGGVQDTELPVYIGTDARYQPSFVDREFIGQIGSVKIWNEAWPLQSDEGPDNGLIGSWNFDDIDGLQIKNMATGEYDAVISGKAIVTNVILPTYDDAAMGGWSDVIEIVGINNLDYDVKNPFAFEGTVDDTIVAVVADSRRDDSLIFFSDGADGYLYVNSAGAAANGALIKLVGIVEPPSAASIIGALEINDVPEITGIEPAAPFSTLEDQPIVIHGQELLANWLDRDGDHLTVQNLQIDAGNIFGVGDGDWQIVPPENFSGPLTLTYEIFDGQQSVITTSTIMVMAVNDEPTVSISLADAEQAAGTIEFADADFEGELTVGVSAQPMVQVCDAMGAPIAMESFSLGNISSAFSVSRGNEIAPHNAIEVGLVESGWVDSYKSVYVYTGSVIAAAPGEALLRWSFASGSWGEGARNITPLLYEKIDNHFVLRAIGDTFSTLENTVNSDIPFVAVAGSPEITNENFYFGWKDGSQTADNGGVISILGGSGGATWTSQEFDGQDITAADIGSSVWMRDGTYFDHREYQFSVETGRSADVIQVGDEWGSLESSGALQWKFDVSSLDLSSIPEGTSVSATYRIFVDDGAGAISFKDLTVMLNRDGYSGAEIRNINEGTAVADNLIGGSGADAIYGYDGDDTLVGDAGDDLLVGGKGSDTIQGGFGDDIIRYDDGVDILDGEEGRDTVDFSFHAAGGVILDLQNGYFETNLAMSHVANAEDVIGTFSGDILFGDGMNNVISGGAGDDIIDGKGGVDYLIGGTGRDVFKFSSLEDLNIGAGFRDVIADFDFGLNDGEGDVIDLSPITNGSAVFIGSADFAVDHTTAMIRINPGQKLLELDIDADSNIDAEIEFVIDDLSKFDQDDFIL